MQTLGLAESTPRSEGRLRALLWPTIRNAVDLDYVTQQGFWICWIVAAMTLVLTAIQGALLAGAIEAVFFFLAGVGVRQRSRIAGIAAFLEYLVGTLVGLRL